LQKAIALGKRIVFVDECIFTTKTIFNRSFSFTKKKLAFPKSNKRNPAICLIAGISEENGLEGYASHQRSVNSEQFIQAIQLFRLNGDNFTLLGDNASWHTSR
jgi:hypothetical protein